MIIKVRRGADQTQVQQLTDWLKEQGLQLYFSEGDSYSIIGLVGDTSRVDIELIEALEVVESVTRIQEPYKNANRKFHPQDTIIKVGDAQIGGGTLVHARLKAKRRSSRWHSASRLPAQRSCAAAHSSLAPRHTPSRAWALKASSCS